MKKSALIIAACATCVCVGLTAPAAAVDEPENIIKYRQGVMKAIGAHIGGIAGVMKGEVSFKGHIAAHARGLHEMSKLLSGDLFPEGTGNDAFPKTRALPKIWTEWSDFEAGIKKMEEESAKLVEVAQSGDMGAIGAQLGNLGKSCGGCHKPFRAEKK